MSIDDGWIPPYPPPGWGNDAPECTCLSVKDGAERHCEVHDGAGDTDEGGDR